MKWAESVFMPRDSSKMGNDLEQIKKRLLAGKKSLHNTELRAENLDASIQTAVRDQEIRKQNRKRAESPEM
jgi:hypothetical protein